MEARLSADSGGGGDALLALSVLHDLLGLAGFLASHPLHAAYILFFSRHLLSLACFFCPLLVTTSLLLAVLVTVAPYFVGGGGGGGGGGGESLGACSLGRTCGIAVGALRAELRPDGSVSGAVALVGQLCSFVLGPGDVAAVLRVGEIMGELCDIGDSCLVLEEKCVLLERSNELATELPWQNAIDGKISTDQVDLEKTKDGIEEKKVVLEDLKELNSPFFSPDDSSASDTSLKEMDEQEQNAIGLSDMDGFSDGVEEEKRLECDPVSISVEIKKCAPVRSLSSVSRRIKQWEDHSCGHFKRVLEEMEDNSVEFSLDKGPLNDVKECDKLEDGAEENDCAAESVMHQEQQEFRDVKECDKLEDGAEENDCAPESAMHQEQQEFRDVKECVQVQTDAETCTENCSNDEQYEESTFSVQSEQESQEETLKDVLPEPELQDQEYIDVEPVEELQDQDEFLQPEEQKEQDCIDATPEEQIQEQYYSRVQPEEGLQKQGYEVVGDGEELRDQEEFKDGEQDPAREDQLKSTSIARRMHSRTSSENLIGEGSPRKDKEWKRTLACKLYEERMQLKLCRDRAVVECSDNMDMLWEAYEVGGGGGGGGNAKRAGSKAKRGSKQGHHVVEGEHEEGEGDNDDDEEEEESSVRQLCCLQALKFSTRKMNFGGGKTSLAKISKVLKRMAALSRSASRRSSNG
ncbi:hypothetical protein GUJ93_ZPchr0011g28926 [Zizania palustris]|uniref:Uncharacterized protein n=1 Tax=Zizania palustris TaxID=103762 RepID=A0A8J5WJS5_ZIZPA|nr:hypothetical protein GUJ93_ZPchr0011g28926 [Zizania palustris]